MKIGKYLKTIVFVLAYYGVFSQKQDSIIGFDYAKAATEAHEKKFFGSETRVFVKYLEREFIKLKFNLKPELSTKQFQNKFEQKNINPPCLNEDFEALPNGALQPTSGWIAAEGLNGYPNSVLCGSVITTFTPTATLDAFVLPTPIIDAECNNVSVSPLGGTKVVRLNKGQTANNVTKIFQTFSVTSSNWFYKYAYKCVLDGSGHACCDQPAIIFNFFDCSNNLISSLSKTLIPNAFNTPCASSSTLAWSTNTATGVSYTSNWVVVSENLSSYIGSCVTVEVIAAQCNGGFHTGYCYYDAKCMSGGISVNTSTVVVSTYTTCAYTATLNALAGFSSYSWVGPAGSGINNDPNSAITATASGVYTLSAGSGTNSLVQTFTLTVNNSQSNVQISNSTFTICQGNPITLQTSGNNLTSYLWSTGATSSSITITPTATTVYSVTATNTLGCVSNDTKTVNVNLCTGMKNISKDLQRIRVYPNPSSDKFTIAGFSNDLITILDEEGKVINKITLLAEENFSKTLIGFKPGIYFVNTINESVKIIVK